MTDKAPKSIYDLAENLGVSTSTVSRVLNRRAGIGAETRRKVLASAKAARFRPRMAARQLTVAVVTDRLQYTTFGGFISCLLSCLVDALSRRDVAVELVTPHSLERLETRLIDGVLAVTWDDSTVECLRRLKQVPVVAINRMDVPEFSSVATDHRRQGEMAVEFLHGRGHRRLAMIVEEQNNWGSQQRVEGFLSKMRELELPIDAYSISFTEHQPLYGLMPRLISGASPTAIFVANENIGLEASHILKSLLRLRIPQDISLLGMESAQVSQFLSPPMATLSQPLEELAMKSLELLLRQIGEPLAPSSIFVETRLIERESVAMLAMAEPGTSAVTGA
jgi:DNA-binding LacI/PurR family transcriptional regulator